jgi:hypothetical protein
MAAILTVTRYPKVRLKGEAARDERGTEQVVTVRVAPLQSVRSYE